jgi:hypothetical protein
VAHWRRRPSPTCSSRGKPPSGPKPRNYAARDWQRAEERLGEAAEVLEGGDLKRATDMAMDAEKRYRETAAEALNEKSKAQGR